MPELKRFWEAHYGSTFKRHLEADEIWWNLMNNKHQTNINKNQTTLDLLASYGWINIGSMHYGMLYFNIFYIYIVSTYLYI
jgi:hypothetical protein